MSSIRAEMSGDTDELLQRLNRLSHLETRGVLNSIAEGLRTSTVERFTEEKTPEGTSWKPSIRAQEEGGKTLTKTTQLKTSIRSEVSDSGLAGFTFIDNLTGGKLTNIKNQFSEKMSGVANAVSSGMLAAKNYASTQLSNMQAAYQSSGGGIKGIVAATMTGVQGTFSTAYSVINNLTGGKLESIRSTISNKIQAAKDTVSSVLDSIKSAFSSKLEAARSVVSSTIEKIKGVFNFSWKLPDLKLPHISVNGGQAPYGIGGKGSLPSFSIQWYKEGGILNGATIFGAMGGNLLGGGEAGAEAVLPLSELWKQMTEIVKGVVKGENEESGDTVQQTGANITSALTSKAASVRKEKESKTTTTKETYTSERWGKEGGTTIHQISFTVDISKIKDLPLLYKLIDELKDAQNRTDSPTPATT